MAKRNSFEIMAGILSLCRRPQIKTKVMYGTNLAWKMLKTYLSQLQSRKLPEVHHSLTRYSTTEKGLGFIEKWSELVELLYYRTFLLLRYWGHSPISFPEGSEVLS